MDNTLLGIFIVTYNRAFLLARTLNYLVDSSLSRYPITVLNNASTDNTVAVAAEIGKRLPQFKLITNKVNLGANANILRAFDYSTFNYTWVLCDDDILDLSDIADVMQVINQSTVDLIHIGAHKQDVWEAGRRNGFPTTCWQEATPTLNLPASQLATYSKPKLLLSSI